METTKSIVAINREIAAELKDPAVAKALVATTFKGLSETSMKQAIFEGMVRGFTFKNFLEKDVYAIPYGDKYSLVTSIDHARKIGMRSGVIGKSAPTYTFMDDSTSEVETCSVTIKRRVGQDIGEFTATVYFSEYSTNKNLWATKPRTMIAKVAEMHALRMACPEEMSQLYTEEEFDKERVQPGGTTTVVRSRIPEDDDGERPNLLIHQNRRGSDAPAEEDIPADVQEDIEANS